MGIGGEKMEQERINKLIVELCHEVELTVNQLRFEGMQC